MAAMAAMAADAAAMAAGISAMADHIFAVAGALHVGIATGARVADIDWCL
jgi:hypothetical protein